LHPLRERAKADLCRSHLREHGSWVCCNPAAEPLRSTGRYSSHGPRVAALRRALAQWVGLGAPASDLLHASSRWQQSTSGSRDRRECPLSQDGEPCNSHGLFDPARVLCPCRECYNPSLAHAIGEMRNLRPPYARLVIGDALPPKHLAAADAQRKQTPRPVIPAPSPLHNSRHNHQ